MRLIHLFRKELTKEASEWVEEDLISEAQANNILARYGSSLEQGKSQTTLGYYVLMSLGVFFAGLSLILVVSENWNDIPRIIRLLGLVAITLGSNLMGAFYYQKQAERPANLWFLFGGISYGVSIMLIAQIYHLGEHFPDGILWWSLGIVLLVVATSSRLLALLMMALAFTWLGVEASQEFYPAIFPLFLLVIAWLIFFQKASNLLYLALIVGSVVWINITMSWFLGDFQNYDAEIDMIPINIALGLILNGFSWRLMSGKNQMWKSYGLVSHLWLLRASIVTLMILSFDNAWREFDLLEYQWFGLTMLFFLAAGALSIWLALPGGKYAYLPTLVIWIYFTLAFFIAAKFPASDEFFSILTNLVLVLMSILLIRRGIHQVESHYFYTGVVTLLVVAIIRYFDLIGGYLGGAALFLAAAGILLGSANYWKNVQKEVDA